MDGHKYIAIMENLINVNHSSKASCGFTRQGIYVVAHVATGGYTWQRLGRQHIAESDAQKRRDTSIKGGDAYACDKP